MYGILWFNICLNIFFVLTFRELSVLFPTCDFLASSWWCWHKWIKFFCFCTGTLSSAHWCRNLKNVDRYMSGAQKTNDNIDLPCRAEKEMYAITMSQSMQERRIWIWLNLPLHSKLCSYTAIYTIFSEFFCILVDHWLSLPQTETVSLCCFLLLFFRMLMDIKTSSILLSNINCANVILVLKPDKDPTLLSSYRPISLINAELKIICKTLARRIEKVTLTSYIQIKLASLRVVSLPITHVDWLT